ncbi:MAG: hypothetical protein MZV64_36935 [Ignavibacteriales bacterium]|nr:hypothetical protein [Ignavibacteriales bacterium]
MLFVTPYPGTSSQAREKGLIPDLEAYVLSVEAADKLLVNLTDMDDREPRSRSGPGPWARRAGTTFSEGPSHASAPVEASHPSRVSIS